MARRFWVGTIAMILRHLFRRKPDEQEARALYERIVAQTRRRNFYESCGVPDTLDGRFELLSLHAFLVLHRLKRDRAQTAHFAQVLFDILFEDLDRNLREMGVGDMGVAPRIKRMAEGFYGRIAAYEHGLADAEHSLEASLRRNLYGTVEPDGTHVKAMAAYMRREAATLASQHAANLMTGKVSFGPPPG